MGEVDNKVVRRDLPDTSEIKMPSRDLHTSQTAEKLEPVNLSTGENFSSQMSRLRSIAKSEQKVEQKGSETPLRVTLSTESAASSTILDKLVTWVANLLEKLVARALGKLYQKKPVILINKTETEEERKKKKKEERIKKRPAYSNRKNYPDY